MHLLLPCYINWGFVDYLYNQVRFYKADLARERGRHNTNTQIYMVKLEQNPDYSARPSVPVASVRSLIASFRLVLEDDYEDEFSLLSTRCRFGGRT